MSETESTDHDQVEQDQNEPDSNANETSDAISDFDISELPPRSRSQPGRKMHLPHNVLPDSSPRSRPLTGSPFLTSQPPDMFLQDQNPVLQEDQKSAKPVRKSERKHRRRRSSGRRRFFDVHKFDKAKWNHTAAETLLKATKNVDKTCRSLVNTCRLLGGVPEAARDASLALAVLDRSLFSYVYTTSNNRTHADWQHPGGVVAFLNIISALLTKMEADLQQLRRTSAVRSFGKQNPKLQSFCTAGMFVGLLQVLRMIFPESNAILTKILNRLPNTGLSAWLQKRVLYLSKFLPRFIPRMFRKLRQYFGFYSFLLFHLTWPLFLLMFAQRQARQYLWRKIKHHNKHLQLSILYWRLCMASLANRRSDSTFTGYDTYRWMLTMVPPNADSRSCFWYENTAPMKLMKRCLDAVYTGCGIYHSWFGASNPFFTPFIVPLITTSFVFHSFSQRRCNDMTANPDISTLNVIWKIFDSTLAYVFVLKIFPVMGLCPELEMVETVPVKLDGREMAQFHHDITFEAQAFRRSSSHSEGRVEVQKILTILDTLSSSQLDIDDDSAIQAFPTRTVNLHVISRLKCEIAPAEVTNLHTATYSRSENVIFFVHGGGWLGKFTASDMLFLSIWSNAWEVPVISCDYTLSPRGPFPNSLMEVYLTYKYVVSGGLGFRVKRIVVIGDSNGGNMAVGLVMKAIQDGLKVPDGLILTGPILNLSKADKSPSRSLFMMDPLVPSNLINQLRALYLPSTCDPETDMFISPLVNAPDTLLSKFPSTSFVVGGYDPFLDDSISFAHRLDACQVETRMRIYSSMPHGMLGFYPISQDCRAAVQVISSWIGVAFQQEC